MTETGRPTKYTEELADSICAKIAYGESLRTISKGEDMPCIQTIFNWLRKYPIFLEQYTRAKEEQAEAFAEDIIDIADDGTNDWMEKYGKDGDNVGWQLNKEHVARSKLRIESRKWLMSKFKAKKYGDSSLLKVADNEGGKLEQTVVILPAKNEEGS